MPSSFTISCRRVAVLFVGLVAVAGCEPEVDEPEVERGTLAITAFVPAGRVECADGCSIDLGEVALGVVRETPLQFVPAGGTVLVSELRREGCPSFTARPPGDLTTRATTSIRLVTDGAGDPGVCATTFSVVTTAQNAVEGVITIEVQATLVDGEVETGAGEEESPG